MNYGATIETDESKLLLPLDPCDVQLKQGHHRPPVTLFNETFGHFVGPEQLLPLVASPNSTDRTASANAEVNAEYASDGANFLGPTNLPNPFDQRIHSGPSGDPQPAFIFTKNLLRVCRGCEMEIHDRHLLCVHRPTHFTIRRGASKGENEYWHEHCLRCCQCEGQLRTGDSCFVRDGRVYCREDHLKSFGPSCQANCSRCAHPIEPAEFVFRSGPSNVFHTHCFKCSCCGNPLTRGDQYTDVAGELICERDLNLMQLQQQLRSGDIMAGTNAIGGVTLLGASVRQATSQSDPVRFHHISPFPDLDFSALQRPIFHHHHGDRSKKIPKRPRTILNAPQRKAFKMAFEKGPKPSRKVREQLARETGLSVRVVQVWFQNQRAKMKKERKREMDKQQNTGGGDSVSTSTDSEKKEDGDSTMPKSPQSETSGKSDTVADDEESDDCDEFDEERIDNTKTELFCRDNESEEAQNAGKVQNEQQNPIEKMHNMYQTYFSFV